MNKGLTLDIFDTAGNLQATVTFYHMGVNLANREALKLAGSLNDKWTVKWTEKEKDKGNYSSNYEEDPWPEDTGKDNWKTERSIYG